MQRANSGSRIANGGFTLVEVCLALLVVGVGLATLLGLFPVGLRESNLAASDTVQSMFADQVLSMLQAKATTITNWMSWGAGHDENERQQSLQRFRDEVCKDLTIPTTAGTHTISPGTHRDIEYLLKNNWIQYRLDIEDVVNSGGYVKLASLRVADKKEQIALDDNPIYYTEFVYMGM